MKKNFIYLTLICMILSAVLIGCDSRTESESSALSSASATELSNYILENMESEDELIKLEPQFVYELYPVTKEQIEEAVLYTGTYSAEEIAVFKVKDGEAEAVKKACEARIEGQRRIFKDYRVAEMDKLSDPYLETEVNTVILVVCNNVESLKEAMDNYK